MRRGWKVLIIVVLVLVVVWVASEIAIPKIASSYIASKVKNKYPQAKNVSATVSAFPAIRTGVQGLLQPGHQGQRHHHR